MVELPIYRDKKYGCPKYNSDPANCCGRWHDAARSRYENHKIELKYLDGRGSKRINAFILKTPVFEYGHWESTKLESAEVQQASMNDWPYLTSDSENALNRIH